MEVIQTLALILISASVGTSFGFILASVGFFTYIFLFKTRNEEEVEKEVKEEFEEEIIVLAKDLNEDGEIDKVVIVFDAKKNTSYLIAPKKTCVDF